MHNSGDNIGGLWQADLLALTVWGNLQQALAKYGSKLDIIYDDSAYPVAGRYSHVLLWNQTS